MRVTNTNTGPLVLHAKTTEFLREILWTKSSAEFKLQMTIFFQQKFQSIGLLNTSNNRIN